MTIAEQLTKKMPVAVATAKLATLAFDVLRRANSNVIIAEPAFVEVVVSDAMLLRHLVGDDVIKAKATEYLRARRADLMKSGPASSKAGHSGGDHPKGEPQHHPEPAAVPAPGRANAAKVIALTIFDTYRLSDGTPLGNIYPGELRRRQTNSQRDAILLKCIMDYAVYDPDKPLREQLAPSVAEDFVRKATTSTANAINADEVLQ